MENLGIKAYMYIHDGVLLQPANLCHGTITKVPTSLSKQCFPENSVLHDAMLFGLSIPMPLLQLRCMKYIVSFFALLANENHWRIGGT